MLEATFLGWQGWLVSTRSTRILVDPLLYDSVGRGPSRTQQRFLFYPQRNFDLAAAACPRIDALLLSHEHEDHFNLPSLARIDRAVPVILSARASTAARGILETMGFRVQLAGPGARFELGDVVLSMWGAEQHPGLSDEWDTLAYLFTAGRASFFSNVDIPVTSEMDSALRALPGAVLVYETMTLGTREAYPTHAKRSEQMHRIEAGVEFAIDDALARLNANERIRPLPGQSFVIDGDRVAEVRTSTPFLSVPPRDQWKSPIGFIRRPDEPFVPLTDARELTDDELDELERGMTRIAEFIYNTDLLRRIYSQSPAKIGTREPTFAWLLCTDDAASVYAFAYRPEACAFEDIEDDDPGAHYAGVVISWAADLLGLLRGEFEPRSIARAISESWHDALKGTSFFREVLWMFFHPLRQPALCLARYRAQLAELGDVEPVFLPPGRGASITSRP